MRILVIHQFYLSTGASGGSRFNEMTRFWTEQGHEVEVIAGTVNYLTNKTPEEYRGKWVKPEKDKAVTVWRCHVPESYGRSYWGRMWAFLSFTFSSTTALWRTKPGDIVLSTSPPLTTAITGWFAARWRGKNIPWVVEVRDLWPESAITTGVLSKNGILARMLYALEKWSYRQSDMINVLTPAFKKDIEKRSLAKADKIIMIPNGADTDLFQPGPRDNGVREEFSWGDRFVVMYCGAHGRANALHQLIEAAELLVDRDDILIACVGSGPQKGILQTEVKRKGLLNIIFCGSQPKKRMPDFVNACDVGAAVLQNNPTFRTVYPNKVFDYMACERPTLLAIDGIARELVCEQAKAGLFVEPENGRAISEAIRLMADQREQNREMGKRGREWVLANATRKGLAMKYLAEMTELISEKSRR